MVLIIPTKIISKFYQNVPPKNCFPSLILLLLTLLQLFIFRLFIVISFKGVSSTPATSILDTLITLKPLTNVTKNSILDVVGLVDLPLNLLGKVFHRHLSVKHTGQQVTGQ